MVIAVPYAVKKGGMYRWVVLNTRSQALKVFFAGTKKDQRPKLLILLVLCGAPGRIRTSDTLIRSQVLYPAELQALISRLLTRPQTRETSRTAIGLAEQAAAAESIQ